MVTFKHFLTFRAFRAFPAEEYHYSVPSNRPSFLSQVVCRS